LPPSAASTLGAVGNTPLVELTHVVPSNAARVLVKLEYFSPTGSYKDRMALSMVERAEQRGTLTKGMTVVEYTGGSTGISLAFVCAVKGYPCRIVTNDAVALEKRRAMEIFGAKLDVMKSDGGKLTPDLVPRMMDRAREIAAEGPSYATDQMRNPDMVAGYESLGEELLRQADGEILRRGRHGGNAHGRVARAEAWDAAGARRRVRAVDVGGALRSRSGKARRRGHRARLRPAAVRPLARK